MKLEFLCYSGLFLRGGSDNISVVVTLAIFDFVILAGVQLFQYAAKGVEPDN